MGDRYDLTLKCAYCKGINRDIWYAPTCSSDTFECKECEKTNFVNPDFKAIKIEDATYSLVREGFLNTTMGGLTDKEIEDNCRHHLKEIQK